MSSSIARQRLCLLGVPGALVAMCLSAGCSGVPEQLQPVKSPPLHPQVCQRAELVPPGQGCAVMDACNFKLPRCGEQNTLVVSVDAQGRATTGFVREQRSPETDACVKSQLAGLTFLPARECEGAATADEYIGSCTIICDTAGPSHSGRK